MGMQIKDISDKAFSAYGKVITGVNTAGILKEMERTPLPDDVIYVPSVPELEALPEAEIIKIMCMGNFRFRSVTATATTRN